MKWSVVCCSKNEGLDILEWVSWYKLQGAERIYLYDALADNTHGVLQKYIQSGFVEFIPWTVYPAQYPAYKDALERFKSTALAFVDADELIVPLEGTISSLLDELILPNVSGIGIGWEIFGNNNHQARPEGLMIENYTRKIDYNVNRETMTKCIVIPDRLTGFVSDPHWYSSKPGFDIVREDGSILKWGEHHHRTNTPFPKSRIRLNHYFTKSFEDFCRKVNRRGPDGHTRLMTDFKCNDVANAVSDTFVLKWADKLKEIIECYK